MAILVAAIGLVGLLCLADLLLTFGVIRRLREHTEQLAGLRGQDAPVTGLPYGATPEPFTALTVSGERLDGPRPLRLGTGQAAAVGPRLTRRRLPCSRRHS